jgi:orotidine-5'-phosphate decarboxylase
MSIGPRLFALTSRLTILSCAAIVNSKRNPMKPELVVALDVPSADLVPSVLLSMPSEIVLFKVGLELFTAEGPSIIKTLANHGKRTFLDLKLHDIPRTVARAVAAAAHHGVALLTVHAGGGREMLRTAAEAARDCGPTAPRLLAVTTLTSLAAEDLIELGITRPLKEHTLALGEMAVTAGIDGLVCSPLEAAEFRARLGTRPLIVTPGIRPAGANAGDQKRIATPAAAVKAGANYLVVGRPILEAAHPQTAALNVLAEMRAA